jgi:2-polyprenyl-3-methyl-5-hydroxy-6-metoxy-1,4-benzoquinol methylase
MQPAQLEIKPEAVIGHATEDADQHSSSDEYAKRFAGPVGEWMLSVQEKALFGLLPSEIISVLDIGGGHGQIALPLSRADKSVTILGSSLGCSDRLKEFIDSGAISFKCGNLIELPFHDRSFDCVTSFRLMSHCTAWETLIAEMCRVATTSVIFDYPVWCSTNFLTPFLFRVKRFIEGNTRRYRIFTTSELRREFKKHGFRCERLQKQFLFPMGLHRALGSPRLSQILESCARVFFLTRLFGSPVIIRFDRINRDD